MGSLLEELEDSRRFFYIRIRNTLIAKIQAFQAAFFTIGIFCLLPSTADGSILVNAQALYSQLDKISPAASGKIGLAILKRFYAMRDYQPVWVQDDKISPELDIAIAFIATAEQEGLDSKDYELEQLLRLRKQSSEGPTPLDLELHTTQAVLTLARDLCRGRLIASEVDPDWHIQQQTFDPADYLQKAINSGNLKSFLEDLSPKTKDYQLMRQALAHYREQVVRGIHWTAIPEIPLIRPNMNHPVIPQIRTRIVQAFAIHGNPEYDIAPSKSEKYDDELVNAIKAFQYQHGLNADGVIGKNTRAALNKTPEQKIRQLRINMERLRWLPRELGDRYLLVNIAGFRLTAIEYGKHILDMRVIVGRDYRSTPSFNSLISHLILNPYWNIPNSIAHKDLLPKQQNNSNYFTSQGISVYSNHDNRSQALNPESINWHAVGKNFPYVLRQNPGEKNALGTIKFMFPNPFSIYLHDTPSKQLFLKDVRMFSSGCIRLEKPLQLAGFVLNEPNAVTDLVAKIESGKTITVNLPRRLPIYLTYLTTWVDELNNIYFSSDTYGRDKRVLEHARW
ncbi:murein L,D-transpeptidase [Nitrosomonas sp. Nm132]|uniref:L,D-transpeptidase family protein n=1 Tax=Nitrosomonas sp. Nm132 TaxID=1881053 RepID=UPI0008918F49|nr:L,D-transpeptidase family protein [Nitrosomonas sp. Nm132]SDG90581.1 Murein L,D-transpeptidase YcbB/YkuD [Nitrosomonas sp. Nm132]